MTSITITGDSNNSKLILESLGGNILSDNDQFIQDFLNPNYFKTVLPFNFNNVEDFDNLVNIFENDPLYGLVATRSAKGSLHILGLKDKDTLMYNVITIWDTYDSWYSYVGWRLTGDPTFVFQQLLNNPTLPNATNAPGGVWQSGYYDPSLVEHLTQNQIAAGINITIDRSNYIFNPVKNTEDFISRLFVGYVNQTHMPSTKQFNYSESVNNMFLLTGASGQSIARS